MLRHCAIDSGFYEFIGAYNSLMPFLVIELSCKDLWGTSIEQVSE